MLVLGAVFYAAFAVILPGLVERTKGLPGLTPDQVGTLSDPRLLSAEVVFAPVMGVLFYAACTFGAWVALRVEDPAKDINWVLVRVSPGRVMADAERKERYRGFIVRGLFLVKTFLLGAFLFVQYWIQTHPKG